MRLTLEDFLSLPIITNQLKPLWQFEQTRDVSLSALLTAGLGPSRLSKRNQDNI